MSLSSLLLALFFIFYGLNSLGVTAFSNNVIGFIALVVGILMIVTAIRPVNLFEKRG